MTDLDEAQPIVISPWGEKKKNYKNRAREKKKKTGATGPFFVPLTKMPRYREMTMTKKKKKDGATIRAGQMAINYSTVAAASSIVR